MLTIFPPFNRTLLDCVPTFPTLRIAPALIVNTAPDSVPEVLATFNRAISNTCASNIGAKGVSFLLIKTTSIVPISPGKVLLPAVVVPRKIVQLAGFSHAVDAVPFQIKVSLAATADCAAASVPKRAQKITLRAIILLLRFLAK